MPTRKEQIDLLIDETHASMLNARREWREHGETAALRLYVNIWCSVGQKLTTFLEDAKAEGIDAARIQAIRYQIQTWEQEMSSYLAPAEEIDVWKDS